MLRTLRALVGITVGYAACCRVVCAPGYGGPECTQCYPPPTFPEPSIFPSGSNSHNSYNSYNAWLASHQTSVLALYDNSNPHCGQCVLPGPFPDVSTTNCAEAQAVLNQINPLLQSANQIEDDLWDFVIPNVMAEFGSNPAFSAAVDEMFAFGDYLSSQGCLNVYQTSLAEVYETFLLFTIANTC